MTDLSGKDANRVFRTNAPSGEPYYYITASMDLTDLEVGEDYVYYFTQENNFSYLDKKQYASAMDYAGYHMIDQNSTIGEIVVYTSPNVEYSYGDIEDLNFYIGGCYNPDVVASSYVGGSTMDVWAGPTGNSPSGIGALELTHAQVCYYGQIPAEPEVDDDDASISRKFLALKVDTSRRVVAKDATASESEAAPKVVTKRPKVVKRRKVKNGRQVISSGDALDAGKIYVVVKVYPKFT